MTEDTPRQLVLKSGSTTLTQRSLWMTLCTLSKQPQIVFVLLELMACRATELRCRMRAQSIRTLCQPIRDGPR